MFCPKCGTQLQDGAEFCPSCGAQLGQQQAQPQQGTQPSNNTPSAGSFDISKVTEKFVDSLKNIKSLGRWNIIMLIAAGVYFISTFFPYIKFIISQNFYQSANGGGILIMFVILISVLCSAILDNALAMIISGCALGGFSLLRWLANTELSSFYSLGFYLLLLSSIVVAVCGVMKYLEAKKK